MWFTFWRGLPPPQAAARKSRPGEHHRRNVCKHLLYRVSLAIAVSSALMAALVAATALNAPGAHAALIAPVHIVRTYTGKVTVATGHYAPASGQVVVHLTLTTGRSEPVEARRVLSLVPTKRRWSCVGRLAPSAVRGITDPAA